MKLRQLIELIGLRRQFRDHACPLCGGTEGRPLVSHDRYLLPIRVRECSACGMIHASRLPDAAGLTKFYARLYPALMGFRPDNSLLPDLRNHAALRVERITQTVGSFDRVLEIGSGFGYFLDACRTAGAQHLWGIEPSEPGVAHGHAALGLAGALHLAPLFGAPPPPFSPQVTALFHVLEHLPDPHAVLKLLAGWITPGNHLVVEVPDTAGDWSSLGVMNFHLSHVLYFRVETLSLLLRRHGFEPITIDQEPPGGIYPGNLRIIARRVTETDTSPPAPLPSLAGLVAARVRPWSFKNGYPRAAIRLLRLLRHG